MFSNKEKIQISNLYKNGKSLRKIAKIFGCSGGPIKKILIEFLGEEKYKKIAKEHSVENTKQWQKAGAETVTEKQRKACQKTGKKYGLENLKMAHTLSRSEKQKNAVRENIKKATKMVQKNHSSVYEKKFKLALENNNIQFKWQEIIDFPDGSFSSYCIVDFFIAPNIIVEIDGWSHLIDPSYDKKRDKICNNLGFKILRFTHEEIKEELIVCIKKLKKEL